MSDETPVISKDEMEHYYSVLSRNMLRIRAMRKLTQAQVASYLGITPSGYGDYERHRCPDAVTIIALANWYNIPVASFFVEYDENGKVSNEPIIKSAMPDHFAAIAEGLQTLAGNMAQQSADRLKDLEQRLRSVELFMDQLKRNN